MLFYYNVYLPLFLRYVLLHCSIGYLIFKPGARRPVAGARLVFKTDPVRIVGVCVCVCVCERPRRLITSGVRWHDIDLISLVKQVLQLLYGNCSRYR